MVGMRRGSEHGRMVLLLGQFGLRCFEKREMRNGVISNALAV